MTPIPLAKPLLGEAELAAVERVLRTGMMTRGPEVLAFEKKLATGSGRAHAVSCSSGSTALELCVWAMKLNPGDEVIVPGFGFPSAAIAVGRFGGVPVPAEVDPSTWNMTGKTIEAVATEKTRGLISIDQFGVPNVSEDIAELVTASNWVWISDSACAIGALDARGVPSAKKGQAAIYSFHPRKLVATGEGGAILCDSEKLAAEFHARRNLGQTKPGAFELGGCNARLSDIAAAIGTVQLERLPGMLEERALLVEGYRTRLADLINQEKISVQGSEPGSKPSNQTFAIVLSKDGRQRDDVIAALQSKKVGCGPSTYASHRAISFVKARSPMPTSDTLHERSIAIPLFCGLRADDLDRVVTTLEDALS